jgi:predicted CXXCH cytochrome family protein
MRHTLSVLAVVLAASLSPPALATPLHLQTPEYVGKAACVDCHETQARLHTGSHHDLAMQPANEETVLGDFDGAELGYAGITSRFYRDGERFMVRTDNAEGELADFEIRYTFGVDPLQQYLIEFPDGRLQALTIAWDARPSEAGGQRWFHLYPDANITHEDELHWTGRQHNWNHMCAECHSTRLRKHYDAARGGFETTWLEIDVSCEACHGPGSKHIAWAQKRPGWERIGERGMGLRVLFDERRDVEWRIDEASGNARRSIEKHTETEIQLCARCHSRRSQLSEDYLHGRPLADTHLPALLTEDLYYPDGQILDEVYVYGSFIQSKMYQAGVTCSDCHDPHSQRLRAPGNGVCLQCHAAARYDTETHHFHEPGTGGASCAECHMPARTYMVVDPRRDHSMRIPRPDLSMQMGTPNACTNCHKDRSDAWAAQAIEEWYGEPMRGHQQFGPALKAAREGTANASRELVALLEDPGQPAIARATAAAELGGYLSPYSLAALREALSDPDPLVRLGALDALEGLPLAQRWQLASPLLTDGLRAVRVEAAGLLADASSQRLPEEQQRRLQSAIDEYMAVQKSSAYRPEAQVNLGNIHAAQGRVADAERAYRRAMALDPDWIPAYVNLADLYRALGRDAEGESVLRDGLEKNPQAAALHHSLGLLKVRQKDMNAALSSLKKAAELAPDNARFTYVYAVGLDSVGRTEEAITIARAGLKRVPADRSLQQLLSQLTPPPE